MGRVKTEQARQHITGFKTLNTTKLIQTQAAGMDTKLVIIATFLCSVLVMYSVTGDPLEDQLPDTTGLFFGKRASHPNLNNLLFGRRSYGQLKNKILHEDARRICRNVVAMCSGLAVEDNDDN